MHVKQLISIISIWLIAAILFSTQAQTQKFNDLLALALESENPVEIKKILLQANPESNDVTDSAKLAYYNLLAYSYGIMLDNDSALLLLNKALEIGERLNFSDLKANTYNQMGNVYRSMSENEMAMDAYNKGLDLLSEVTPNDGILRMKAKLIGNIGGIYYDMKCFDKSIEYASMSYGIVKANKFEDRIPISHLMLAFAFRANGQLDSALYHNLQVIELLGEKTVSPYNAHCFYNIGTIYSQKKEFKRAEESFNRSMQMSMEVGENEVYVSDWIELAKLYLETNQLSKALDAANQAEKFSVQFQLLHKHIEAMEVKYRIQKQSGQLAAGIESVEKLIGLKDSLFKAESAGKIQEIESRYQKRQDQQKIQELETLSRLQELEVYSAQQTRWVLIVLVCMLLVLVAVIYNRYQFKIKTSTLLNQQNQALQEANQFKDRMFAIVSHDLKSPLSSFSSITSTINEYFDQLNPQDVKQYMSKLSQASKALELQMKNLLEWSISQLHDRVMKVESINLYQVAEELRDFFSLNLSLKQLNLWIEVPKDTMIDADKEYVHTILRNLISNAIKFTPAGGSIWMSTKFTNDGLRLEVKDSGIGIAREDFDKLFSLTADKKSIGNSGEKGTGLGLVLVKELADKLGASIDIQSEIGTGTTFTLHFRSTQQRKAA